METRRWINQTQPQTLVIAVLLLYIDAAFDVLALLGGGGRVPLLFLALMVGKVAAGFGISNERKWGYYLGVAIAVLALLPFLLFGGLSGAAIIPLMFAIARLALLLHPQSREYQRIWFK
jgi:hypothetical protein